MMTTQESSPGARPSLGAAEIVSLLLPPLVLMTVIFYLSAQPNLVPTHGFWETLARKTFHTLEYFLLTMAWWRATHGLMPGRGKARALVLALAVTLLFSISDELHQSFVQGRHGTPRDVAIDVIGMLLASSLVLVLYARRRRVGPSRPRAA